MYWSLECELNGTMDRKTASTYYDQQFLNAAIVFEASTAAVVMVWISGLLMIFAVLGLAGSIIHNESWMGMYIIALVLSFISWLVTLPILFHRYNAGWNIAQQNMMILNDQAKFNPTALACGDPLNAMNIDVATLALHNAQRDIAAGWRFTMSMLVIAYIQIVAPIFIPLIQKICSCFKSSAESTVYSVPVGAYTEVSQETP